MNRNLFAAGKILPPDAANHAGGIAYALPPKQALAQLAVTGFFGDTFYVSAEQQLDEILAQAKLCDDEFVAQVAVYARHAGFMKDTPAVLLAYLFGKRSPALTPRVFNEVIDNVKMLSNFVMGVRSGKFGRKSLGTKGQNLIENWLAQRSLDYLWKQSIAKDPSLADILRLAHARPVDASEMGRKPVKSLEREGLYKLLCSRDGTPVEPLVLPRLVLDTLAFRKAMTENAATCQVPLPDVPFNMIDSLPLRPDHWQVLFERGGWQFLRMNLKTMSRHGLFKNEALVANVARRLSDPELVRKARQFPYQILTAYKAVERDPELPLPIRSALHTAVEHATLNVPALPGRIVVAVDCSGSMSTPVTGSRGEATTNMSYADVAALFAAAIVRRNPTAKVMTFSESASYVAVEPMDTILSIATKLARAGGGTDTSAPLRKLAFEQTELDVFILISDNEGWLDRQVIHNGTRTGSVAAWEAIKRKNPNARQIRINISPNATDQLPKRSDTLRIAGFSDAVFTSMSEWRENRDWVTTVSEFRR